MNNEEYKQFYMEATKVLEVIEDSVAHICDEEKLSGEKVWHMIAACQLSSVKNLIHLTLLLTLTILFNCMNKKNKDTLLKSTKSN